ncbi:MAG: dUTP diphosphatase ['Candidatus Kapabacteria' thiocyanatum]|uniref:Deoxyuridine 5'-triphosphate nucleotidohydrolase n=1 Tax=Candidatus Kapaibacterium thiocyanatum TaxID=1895771 RepID=A0A1M3L3M5_9BACT|nr:dUTP diphosphatase ['Candidatus Kapabacteria' thiocyanatum]OJX59925.1 MAG: deoxyuridine 5'-triphosphate nucleotidohydrolase ['Candidatus Kapabacteria' thiocyanatum]
MNLQINITRLPHAADLPLPSYATSGAAGMDVHAAVDQALVVQPGSIALVPTGLVMAIPKGFECQVRSRSGLAARNGVFALNAPGTIDSDYRGEVKVILANISGDPFTIERGSRIAQLVVARHEQVEWRAVEAVDATERGSGGFGSTGVHP